VACEQMLEDEGVLDVVNIGEYHLGLIPFDSDLVSLEISDLYKQCYVDNDLSPLDTVARSLHKLQSIYGLIPHIKSKGSSSKKVLQKLLHICRENNNSGHEGIGGFGGSSGSGGGGGGVNGGPGGGSNSGGGGLGGGDAGAGEGIDTLVLLDREVDLFSCLLIPLTYEGLIDECMGIDNGRVKVDMSVLGDDKDTPPALLPPSSSSDQQQQQVIAAAIASSANEGETRKYLPGDKVAIALNNTDVVFKECRDLSIEALGTYLQEKAILIRKRYSDFRDNKDASISEIHGFVKKIPELTKEYKSLNQHINIAELLKVTTDSAQFRSNWQTERGILEGEPALLEYVEDLIIEDCTERTNFFKILKLFCLSSLTSNGIQAKKFDHLRKLIVHTYGFEHLFTITNLEKAGLLRRKENILLDTSSTASSPMWVALRTQLK
jgi:vacuolar protein sorting-associated protein 33A